MPVMFVLGLAAVFGDLVETVLGQDYIQFLLPGVLVMQITLAAGTTGVGIATDLRDGIIDRFRSLPMAQIRRARRSHHRRPRPQRVRRRRHGRRRLRDRLPADGGVLGGIAALAVALLFGYAITWVFAAVGLAVKDPQAANFIGFAPVLLFVYLSSAWVPIDTMHPAVQRLRPPPTRQRHDRSRPRPRQRNRHPDPMDRSASPGPSASSPSSRGSPPDSSAQQPPDQTHGVTIPPLVDGHRELSPRNTLPPASISITDDTHPRQLPLSRRYRTRPHGYAPFYLASIHRLSGCEAVAYPRRKAS